jgi:hypothetical protein
MGGTLPKNQNPSFLSASFYLILAVDLSIDSPFFLLFGDDARGLLALTLQSSASSLGTSSPTHSCQEASSQPNRAPPAQHRSPSSLSIPATPSLAEASYVIPVSFWFSPCPQLGPSHSVAFTRRAPVSTVVRPHLRRHASDQ